jgi:hypothetical protein
MIPAEFEYARPRDVGEVLRILSEHAGDAKVLSGGYSLLPLLKLRLASPALVVAPTSLMANWRREAEKFVPDLKVLTLQGDERKKRFDDIGASDLVLTTYPLIARDHETLSAREWRLLFLDEAQTIKNPNATTTKLIRTLKAEHRFCLTGTPMENHLGELWSIFSFASPGFLGDLTGFNQAFRTPIEKKGDAQRGRLLARRVAPFLLRRTKEEVANDLPPKTEIVERIENGDGAARPVRIHPPFDARTGAGSDLRERFRSQPDHHSRRAAETAPGLLRSAPVEALQGFGESRLR